MKHDPLVTLGYILLVLNVIAGTVAFTFGWWPLTVVNAVWAWLLIRALRDT